MCLALVLQACGANSQVCPLATFRGRSSFVPLTPKDLDGHRDLEPEYRWVSRSFVTTRATSETTLGSPREETPREGWEPRRLKPGPSDGEGTVWHSQEGGGFQTHGRGLGGERWTDEVLCAPQLEATQATSTCWSATDVDSTVRWASCDDAEAGSRFHAREGNKRQAGKGWRVPSHDRTTQCVGNKAAWSKGVLHALSSSCRTVRCSRIRHSRCAEGASVATFKWDPNIQSVSDQPILHRPVDPIAPHIHRSRDQAAHFPCLQQSEVSITLSRGPSFHTCLIRVTSKQPGGWVQPMHFQLSISLFRLPYTFVILGRSRSVDRDLEDGRLNRQTCGARRTSFFNQRNAPNDEPSRIIESETWLLRGVQWLA